MEAHDIQGVANERASSEKKGVFGKEVHSFY